MKKTNDREFFDLVDRGIREGVACALARHKQAGIPIVVWRNGKIVEIPPKKIRIPKIKS